MNNTWKFRHLGIAVADIDRAVSYYQSLGVADLEPEIVLDTHDKKSKVRIRFLQIGSLRVELLQPLGPSVYGDFLGRHGDGLQHIAFTVDDLEKEAGELGRRGARRLSTLELPDGRRLASFDTGGVGDIHTELVQPAPEKG